MSLLLFSVFLQLINRFQRWPWNGTSRATYSCKILAKASAFDQGALTEPSGKKICASSVQWLRWHGSISVLQWLFNAETSHSTSSPPHRLTRFFTTLHSALKNPSRAVLQSVFPPPIGSIHAKQLTGQILPHLRLANHLVLHLGPTSRLRWRCRGRLPKLQKGAQSLPVSVCGVWVSCGVRCATYSWQSQP